MNINNKYISFIKLLTCIFMVIFISMPLIQRSSRIFPLVRLSGAEVKPKRPELSIKSWFNGEYANSVETYFAFKVGFRGLCVRIIHQINFFLFKDIEGNSKTSITLGKDGWLYETGYVNHYICSRVMYDEEIEFFLSDLESLKEELSKLGIVFVVVISPSKAEIVEEYLPDRVKKKALRSRANNYKVLIPKLHDRGILVADAHELFMQLRKSEPYLFPRGGTHWSYYGSFLFCRKLLETIKPKMPEKIVVPNLSATKVLPAMFTDRDLVNLLNLLFCNSFSGKMPYPEITVDALPMEKRPNLLLVGDSFAFTLIDSLNQSKAINKMDLLYYNNRYFDYPAEDIEGYSLPHHKYKGTSVDHKNMDWGKLLFSKDIVILEMNEILLNAKGWGFVQDALKAIRKKRESSEKHN